MIYLLCIQNSVCFFLLRILNMFYSYLLRMLNNICLIYYISLVLCPLFTTIVNSVFFISYVS